MTIEPAMSHQIRKEKKKCFEPFKGYTYAVIAATNFCVGNCLVKLAMDLTATDHLVILNLILLVAMLGNLYLK